MATRYCKEYHLSQWTVLLQERMVSLTRCTSSRGPMMSSHSKDQNLEKFKLFGSASNQVCPHHTFMWWSLLQFESHQPVMCDDCCRLFCFSSMVTKTGQWRLGGLGLSVVYPLSDQDHSGEEVQFTGFHYDFIADDILLGEGNGTSMVELKPCQTVEISGPDPFVLLSRDSEESTSTMNSQISNEESMREYADLKVSLLLYDAVLIVIGSSVLSISSGENSALAFSTGGVGGFLYLLLLQRSVDELPSPASISKDSVDRIFGRFWGPISTVAVAVAFVLLALKYGSGENPVAFTPKELVLAMMGFLACKVAVVLAAFKPVTRSWNRPSD